MVRGATLCIGEGARCSVLVKNLRPMREVTQRILNPVPRQHVTDLVAIRHGNITRGTLMYEAKFFTSPLFPDLKIHTAKNDWHFHYRHAVDDHNNLRHALPSVEDTWLKKRWECRVFTFILAMTEINTFLAFRYFVFGNDTIEGCPTLLIFRRRLAWQLINNPWI